MLDVLSYLSVFFIKRFKLLCHEWLKCSRNHKPDSYSARMSLSDAGLGKYINSVIRIMYANIISSPVPVHVKNVLTFSPSDYEIQEIQDIKTKTKCILIRNVSQ